MMRSASSRWRRAAASFACGSLCALAVAAPPAHAQGVSTPRAEDPAAGGSIIDRHGQDGLSFTLDDPLRVNADAHRGVFFLSYNAVGPFDPRGHACLPPRQDERIELCFIDMSSNTITRRSLFPPAAAWDRPLPIGPTASPPADWQEHHDYFVAGGGMQHDIAGTGPDDPAMKIDPRWVRRLGTVEPYASLAERLVDHVKLDGVAIDNNQYVTCFRTTGGLRQSVATALGVWLGDVHPVLKGGATITFPSGDLTSASQVPEGFREVVAGKIAADARLAGRVTTDQILTAAIQKGGDCATAGVRDSELCAPVRELIASTRGDLKILRGTRGIIQEMIDRSYGVDRGNPVVYGWLPWKDPVQALVSSVVSEITRVELESELGKLLRADAPGVADRTGAHAFDSGFMYGPKGRWLIANRGEPGFVEHFVFTRLNQVNPYELEEQPGGRARARWRQVDLITYKPNPYEPPRAPWPPVPAGWSGPAPWWRSGTAQLVGDEAATGSWDREGPEQVSSMLMSVAPDERSDRVHLAFMVRSADLRDGAGPGRQLDWTPYSGQGLPAVSLPPGYRAAGSKARSFRVGLTNRRPGATTFQFRWDLDADGAIDTHSGNMVRKVIENARRVASCFVEDPASGRTGLASTVVEP